jgi:hypothetical protein
MKKNLVIVHNVNKDSFEIHSNCDFDTIEIVTEFPQESYNTLVDQCLKKHLGMKKIKTIEM